MQVTFDTLKIEANIFSELKKNPEWFEHFKNDNSLYIEIRKDNQVNIYSEGGSVARIHYCSKLKKLQVFTHYKYLGLKDSDKTDSRSFFADWTIRHPDVENGELLQHCGPWPISIAKETPKLTYPLAFDHPGSITAEAKHGDVSLVRFDGDNGEYSLLLGNAKGIDGPKGMGTYLWVEVENIKRLEAKLVEGPYIHHCVGIHKNVVPVLYEACKYIGVTPDLYDPIEEDVKAYLRGE